MNHSDYALTAACGGDEVLRSFDGRREFVAGKPTQEGVFARLLRRFRPEISPYVLPTGQSFAAGENTAAFVVNQLGTERMMEVLQAGPRLRAQMSAVLEAEWGPKAPSGPFKSPKIGM